MAESTQSFEKHAKWVVGYHLVTSLFLLVFTVWAILGLARNPGFDTFALFCAMVTLHLLGFYVRAFATGNQDRIIRLEERLRMRELLPADQHAHINDYTAKQMVALRFASDEELPALAAKVRSENITDTKKIKSLIQNWRADHQRI